MGTLWRTDPILKLLDPESTPMTFQALPDEEQRWRGRLFFAIWWLYSDEQFSWAHALLPEPEVRDIWANVKDYPDDLLLARIRAKQAQMAIEAGTVPGPTQ